jgi:hydrogenase-4 membrane subunit HyfE
MTWLPSVLILFVLSNFLILMVNHKKVHVVALASQGIMMAIFIWMMTSRDESFANFSAAMLSAALKTIIFPMFVAYSSPVQTNSSTQLSKPTLLAIALILVGYASWMTKQLPTSLNSSGQLVLMSAMSAVFIGLLILIAPRGVMQQAMGYLIFENGISLFAVAVTAEEEWAVQVAVLLDVLVAVVLMGITIFHLRQEFDEIDVDQLSILRD